ncbi:MAG: PHP domain-containing protein [Clostridia bacterium]|nr:PHP domain-containing protein [Clostridia bacterium]
MRYTFDHDLHIHSGLSLCSNDVEQTPARLIQYAKDNGLKTICLTDHYWEKSVPRASGEGFYKAQDFDHIKQACPLPNEEGIKFLFGCETDMDKELNLGITKERFECFDFVIIPTTHMHMHTPSPDNIDPEYRANIWLERLEYLLNMDLPFYKIGIAHLATFLINRTDRESYLKTLDCISDNDLKRIFTKASALGVGIELNQDDMSFSNEEADRVLRIFKIAKECCCKFYLGSDAHHPNWFSNTKSVFERAITLLNLTENDKFILK